MKKISITLLFLLLTINIKADLLFNKIKHNFGTITQFSTVSTVFFYTNKSDETIKIKSIHTTCGCTVPLNYKKILKPGEVGSVTIIFNSEDFTGLISREIFFETKPRLTTKPKLTIIANVIPKFKFTPDKLIIDIKSGVKSYTRKIVLTSQLYEKFTIKKLTYNKRALNISVNKISENKYYIILTLYSDYIKADKFHYYNEKIIFYILTKTGIKDKILYFIYGRKP